MASITNLLEMGQRTLGGVGREIARCPRELMVFQVNCFVRLFAD